MNHCDDAPLPNVFWHFDSKPLLRLDLSSFTDCSELFALPGLAHPKLCAHLLWARSKRVNLLLEAAMVASCSSFL